MLSFHAAYKLEIPEPIIAIFMVIPLNDNRVRLFLQLFLFSSLEQFLLDIIDRAGMGLSPQTIPNNFRGNRSHQSATSKSPAGTAGIIMVIVVPAFA